MTQPEEHLTRRIVDALDQGADQVDPVARARLADARERALERFSVSAPPGYELAWAGQSFSKFSGLSSRTRNVVVVATLLLVISGLVVWNRLGPSHEVADVDAALLADELPINAYLDKGFEAWLKRGSR